MRRRSAGGLCADEVGSLNLQSRPGRRWAAVSGKGREPGRAPQPRVRATYARTAGMCTCLLPWRWARTSCSGTSSRANSGPAPGVCCYRWSLYPAANRIAIICGNYYATARLRRS
jgi:hypothetical protein